MAEDGTAAKHVAPTGAHGHVEGEPNVILECLHRTYVTPLFLCLEKTKLIREHRDPFSQHTRQIFKNAAYYLLFKLLTQEFF